MPPTSVPLTQAVSMHSISPRESGLPPRVSGSDLLARRAWARVGQINRHERIDEA